MIKFVFINKEAHSTNKNTKKIIQINYCFSIFNFKGKFSFSIGCEK